MSTSDPGAMLIGDCESFNTVILAAKDASLTYEARTNEKLNGYTDAQPNALTLKDNDPSYFKIRGYAIQPDKLVNPEDAQKAQILKSALDADCDIVNTIGY